MKKNLYSYIPFIVLIVAFFLFFISNPLPEKCDQEVLSLKKSLAGVIYSQKIKNNQIPSELLVSRAYCKDGKILSSCESYIKKISFLIESTKNIADECLSSVFLDDSINVILKNFISEVNTISLTAETADVETKDSFCKIFKTFNENLDSDKKDEVLNMAKREFSKYYSPIADQMSSTERDFSEIKNFFENTLRIKNIDWSKFKATNDLEKIDFLFSLSFINRCSK